MAKLSKTFQYLELAPTEKCADCGKMFPQNRVTWAKGVPYCDECYTLIMEEMCQS